jgi:pantothenate kinase
MPVDGRVRAEDVTVGQLLDALGAAMRASPRRLLVGIAGCPGAGKSTLARGLVEGWNDRSGGEAAPTAAYVPMDGFHLANAALVRLGRAGRKGAPDTFDAAGYVALLQRLRDDSDGTVWAPAFDRALEEPIAGAIAVDPTVRLVVTEGNYLLLDEAPWQRVPELLHETWFLDVADDELRLERLVARHIAFGRTPAEARAWADGTDAPNARRIRASRERAGRVIVLAQDALDQLVAARG